jgi:NitT/TauT family transport system permease protein
MAGPPQQLVARVAPGISVLPGLSIASLAACIGAWIFVAESGVVPRNVLPSPMDVLSALADINRHEFAGATLRAHILASAWRFLGGFFLAVAAGIPIGLAMAWFAPFRHVIAPFFEAFRFIAPLAWVPFAALWFGTGIGGPILIVFSGAFAACVVNTFRGARLDQARVDEARGCSGPRHGAS